MTQRERRDPEAPPVYREARGSYRGERRPVRRYHHDPDEDSYADDDDRGPRRPRGRSGRRWGMWPGQVGVCVVIGSAAAGGLVTALLNRTPGVLLGVFVVAGTAAAALAVRPRTGYLLIPVPALSYLVAAVIAGLIHDRTSDVSRTADVINATQWVADGFIAMATATALAILITAARWRRKPQR